MVGNIAHRVIKGTPSKGKAPAAKPTAPKAASKAPAKAATTKAAPKAAAKAPAKTSKPTTSRAAAAKPGAKKTASKGKSKDPDRGKLGPVVIRFPQSLIDRIDVLSKAGGYRSRGAYVRAAVEAFAK